MKPAILGFARSLGILVLITVLSYISDATNLAFVGNPWFEALIASMALAIEHQLEAKTGRAMFGAMKGTRQ
jgi:hypothetical protein